MNFNNIPAELKTTGRFCVWKRESNGKGGITKVPYNVRTGYGAKANDVGTFTDYNAAVIATQSGKYDGIGLGIFADVCAIDIDHCVENGVLSEQAKDIIDTMNAYTEYSPSGEGIRILFSARDFPYDTKVYFIMKRDIGLEVYVAGVTSKYVTVTGNAISAGEYGDRTRELQIVLDKYMKRNQGKIASVASHQGSSSLSDDEVVKKARAAKNGAKFSALYEGDITMHPSHSEADLALCAILAFWCGKDIAQIDRIFRGSGLYREKWDRSQAGTTYGKTVIATAVSRCTNVYTPSKRSDVSQSSTTKEDKSTQALETFSAAELMNMDVEELEFLVENLIHQGLCILSADPKSGKSFFALDLCLSLASGVQFLGRETNQCGTLYLALEDGKRRLKKRMKDILKAKGIQRAPDNCYLTTAADPLDRGLLDQLEDTLKLYPDIKLIVIDVFNRIRESKRSPGKLAYEIDSAELAKLKEFADEHNLCLMLVHHNRKAKDVDDPFQNILGSQGIFGAADEILVFTKKARTDAQTTLHVTSREMSEFDWILEFDKTICLWKYIGSVEEKREEELTDSPIVKTIFALLEESPDKRWEGSATELLRAGAKIIGSPIANNAQRLGYKLKKLEWPDQIIYSFISNGTAPKKHRFEMKINAEVEMVKPQAIFETSLGGAPMPDFGIHMIEFPNWADIKGDIF